MQKSNALGVIRKKILNTLRLRSVQARNIDFMCKKGDKKKHVFSHS